MFLYTNTNTLKAVRKSNKLFGFKYQTEYIIKCKIVLEMYHRSNCLKRNSRYILICTNPYLAKHLYHPQTFTSLKSESVSHHSYRSKTKHWVDTQNTKTTLQNDEGQSCADKSQTYSASVLAVKCLPPANIL